MSEVTDTEIAELGKRAAEAIIASVNVVASENPKLFLETVATLLGRELAMRRWYEDH